MSLEKNGIFHICKHIYIFFRIFIKNIFLLVFFIFASFFIYKIFLINKSKSLHINLNKIEYSIFESYKKKDQNFKEKLDESKNKIVDHIKQIKSRISNIDYLTRKISEISIFTISYIGTYLLRSFFGLKIFNKKENFN